MNYQKFIDLKESDIHSLSDIIKKGEIPFKTLLEYSEKTSFPPLLVISSLQHPDCTLEYFKNTYGPLVKKTGTLAVNSISKNAPILNKLEAIGMVVFSKESTIESIKEQYSLRKDTFRILVSNSHINEEFKVLYYELTGDATYLPQTAQDLFIF
jgi:hypothetical protein